MLAELDDNDALGGRVLVVDAAFAVLGDDELHGLVEPAIAAIVLAVVAV